MNHEIDSSSVLDHSINNSQHDQLIRSLNLSGTMMITSKQKSKLLFISRLGLANSTESVYCHLGSLFSRDENARPSSSYSSFRDEFSHRQILNNPFDFEDSYEEEQQRDDEDEPTVIILSGSK